jgi:hypothetical protein
MAIANGFTTLMMRKEVKERYVLTKKQIEGTLGVSITHSQAIDLLCRHFLTVRTSEVSDGNIKSGLT